MSHFDMRPTVLSELEQAAPYTCARTGS